MTKLSTIFSIATYLAMAGCGDDDLPPPVVDGSTPTADGSVSADDAGAPTRPHRPPDRPASRPSGAWPPTACRGTR